MLVVDTREKWTQPNSKDTHIKDYFDRHGIEYTIRKLDYGDYMLTDKPYIVIDRKQSLDEASKNLMNRSDRSRFWREVKGAHDNGIHLVVLVESGNLVRSINDVPKWRSKYSPVTGRRLIDEMIRLEMAYGVEWQFCSKRSTAKRILNILEGVTAKRR